MKLTTEVEVGSSSFQLGLDDAIVIMGSCFAQEVGAWFESKRFNVCVNPNGILFHPSVMSRCLTRAMQSKTYTGNEWVEHNGLFHSFDHHGKWSNSSADALTQSVNEQLSIFHDFLKSASTLILTWGSAWGYQWKANGEWVANCHKIPQAKFTKSLQEASVMESEWSHVIGQLREMNPALQIILTVSPVRYWRDGAHGNQLSKANLMIAANALANKFDFVHYFPAYEIMVDELRDYRFYAADMLHPSEVAVEYILEKFKTAFLDSAARDYIKQIEPLLKFINHRPLHVSSGEWDELRARKEAEIDELLKKMKA
jgi:hypothetical protein